MEDRAVVLLKDPLGQLRVTSRPLVEISDDVFEKKSLIQKFYRRELYKVSPVVI